ncbi:MAG: DegV family protein [Lachnospiraceae bacterium]|nr:DegV family protein [Lachnospiraceae bacterium]
MKKIAILSDSTCDLSEELVNKYEVIKFPLHIHLHDKEYSDGVDISPEEIYRWSECTNDTPKTSAISLEAAMTYLQRGLQSAQKVICFCISESMSSCFSVMNMAVQEMEAEDRVFIIDSANLSTGIGLMIVEAGEMIKEGIPVEEIVKRIDEMKPKVRSSFVVDTLTYLHRGGRCSGAAALAGNALKIHPSIHVQGGKMYPGKKYRGKMEKVILNYVDDLKEGLHKAKKDHVFITHSGCSQELLCQVQKLVEEKETFKNVYITRAGGVVSSHCGPGTLGVLFVEE